MDERGCLCLPTHVLTRFALRQMPAWMFIAFMKCNLVICRRSKQIMSAVNHFTASQVFSKPENGVIQCCVFVLAKGKKPVIFFSSCDPAVSVTHTDSCTAASRRDFSCYVSFLSGCLQLLLLYGKCKRRRHKETLLTSYALRLQ